MKNCLPKPKFRQKLPLVLAEAEASANVPSIWHAEAKAWAHL